MKFYYLQQQSILIQTADISPWAFWQDRRGLEKQAKNAVDVYVHHTIQLFHNTEIFLFIFSSEIRSIYVFLQELLIK